MCCTNFLQWAYFCISEIKSFYFNLWFLFTWDFLLERFCCVCLSFFYKEEKRELTIRKTNNSLKKMGRRPKQTFLQIQDRSKHKTYRWPINIWKDDQRHSLLEKCKSKLQRGYHLILIGMAIIKKSTNNTCWRGCGGRGTLLHSGLEGKLIQSLWRTVGRFL